MRSAMCAANQLSGRGPTDVDVAPVPEHNQKFDYHIYDPLLSGVMVVVY